MASGVNFGHRAGDPSGSIRVASSDVEEATERVGQVFHPHQLTRVGPVSHFHADLNAVSVGAMVSGRLRYNSNSDLYCPNIDGYHVNVPLTGRLLSISRGRRTTAPRRRARRLQ
ncbi:MULTISPECIES: AraC-like ligand-binding domain-containing protein [Pseudonocardia]|uniref:Transcription regulator HTH AraC- type ligand binding domain-containing protein n=2 Tax=Pseudonocardia TaxID=1847 RepID=A0A1Y2MML8_PSEAH|nr:MULTISPECIES: hypothetical protein [Pseudonocardia]OSY36432.1 hypothetical protein BG845_05354 [Pseudonocardia autotrophica]TDN74724.1 AraC-like protein [Pseudonocardia autotrophica]BBG05499.1 hypothetical protein Pdca_67080 [Pseudonocardia autotrophica]GEC28024.1 hypothetical protein PSA01_50530 [Pseudonocardia saturnea]